MIEDGIKKNSFGTKGKLLESLKYSIGLPWWLSGKESTRRHRACVFDPKVWSRKWQPTPVFLPGKIPWTEEPGRLQPIGSPGVRRD